MAKNTTTPARNAHSRGGKPTVRKATTGPGRSRPAASGTRPLGPRPQRVPATAGTPARRRLERASVVPLLRLRAMPRWFLPAILGALLLLGLFVSSAWAGLFLLAVAVFLGWLTTLSWPALQPSARLVRSAVVAVVAVAAIWRLTGNG